MAEEVAWLIIESGACTGPWFGPDPSREGSYNVSATFAEDVLGAAPGAVGLGEAAPPSLERRGTLSRPRRPPAGTLEPRLQRREPLLGVDHLAIS